MIMPCSTVRLYLGGVLPRESGSLNGLLNL
jgi:hypothetical protein